MLASRPCRSWVHVATAADGNQGGSDHPVPCNSEQHQHDVEESGVSRKHWVWVAALVSIAVAAWAGTFPLSFAPVVNVELGPSGCTAGVDCSEGAVSAVAGDFNGDGKLDI